MRVLYAIAALAVALLLAACGGADGGEGARTGTGTAADDGARSSPAGHGEDDSGRSGGADKSRARKGIEITAASSQFGPILFDGDDRAVYYFDKERSSRSECYGKCAAAWPPVLTDGEPRATGAAEQALLDTTERDGGELQVTYGGRPLYYYVDDPTGQALCHNVDEFGGLWLVVEPDGDPVS